MTQSRQETRTRMTSIKEYKLFVVKTIDGKMVLEEPNIELNLPKGKKVHTAQIKQALKTLAKSDPEAVRPFVGKELMVVGLGEKFALGFQQSITLTLND